ncbi:transglycosylase domain-containing protein [Myxococcaceae bacterium GXIMD 01537]
MRSFLWILLFATGMVGVAIPASFFYTASKLPPMASEFDIEKQLKHSIEGERISYLAGLTEKPKRSPTFTRPDFSRMPKDLVALYITQMGCPTYFQTPREDGGAWGWRLFSDVAMGTQPEGDGACELILARRIAAKLGVKDNLELVVAAHKLHTFLQKDQLIAYDLAILYFERGIVGVEDAAFALYGRELDTLQLAELAELQLVLPPYRAWEDIRTCGNASIIRQNRDAMLVELANWQLITQERARNAMAQPVACLSTR